MSNSTLEYMQKGLPLVNQINIGNYKNQYVVAHGKVQGIKNNILNLLIDPIDSQEILINRFNKRISSGEYIAIIGKVASDKSLDFVDMIQLDKEFDLEFVNEIIPISGHSAVNIFFNSN